MFGITTVLAICATWPAQAEVRALLVGVSGYADRPLKGPRNDVRRMRELLELRGARPGYITTLADGVPGAGTPTRAAILASLDDLAMRAKSGDTVFLYFSGHGSQQPADRATPQGRGEADGLHETFLPLDIGRWDGRAGTVRNALIDFELRAKVDQILARGTFLWAVFDACHSATLVRGTDDREIRDRHVSPLELGVPAALLDAIRPDASSGTRGGSTMPSFNRTIAAQGGRAPSRDAVYFYASQTTERTIEMLLPPGEAQREDQGLFSFALRRALASGRPMSYRQLAQNILAQYGGLNLTDTTPLFAGNALDRMVFGQQNVQVNQWPVSHERMTVPVGTLSGLTDGARFALLPHSTADAGQSIGMLQAVRVGLNHADLEPVVEVDKRASRLGRIPAGAQARLLSKPERYSLRVAVDDHACKKGCRWRTVLDLLRAQGVPGADVQWVGDGGDMTLSFSERELVGLRPGEPASSACKSRSPQCKQRRRGVVLLIEADGDDPVRLAHRLAERLHTVSRAINLHRLAARVDLPDGPGVEASLALQPAGVAGIATRKIVTPGAVARAAAGDQLIMSLHNQGKVPADVTLLYIDANHGIDVLFPSRAGDVNRLEPGARLEIDGVSLNNRDGVFGTERVLAIAVGAERQTQRADFSFLTQPPLLAARPRTAVIDDDVAALFDAAYPGTRGRADTPRPLGRRTRILMFSIDLAPAQLTRER